MLGIFITLLTFVLILISLFMVLVILMQRGSSQGGMGAAFGGGVAESTFGAETNNVLTRATRWSAIAFFVIASGLYLMHVSRHSDEMGPDESLPDIQMESAPAAAGAEFPTEPEMAPTMGEDAPVNSQGTDEPAAATTPAPAGDGE